jgi:hypothetical protein
MSRKRRAWSPYHIRTMKRMAQKKPVRVIARKLNRTHGAVRLKAFAIGVSLETRPGALAA